MTRSIKMVAKYDSTCLQCGEAIRAGVDTIYFYRRGRLTSVTHADCDASRKSRKRAQHDAECEARYALVEGPLPFVRLPEKARLVTEWHYVDDPDGCRGFSGCAVRVYIVGESLIMGLAGWDGWRWAPCVEV